MIRLDADKRAAREALRREIRLLEKPAKDVDRKRARLERRERVKAIGKPAKGQRQPRVRNNTYLAFLRRQPCLKCGSTPCDAAHIRWAPPGSGWRYVGKAEKPDDLRATPLCRSCHELQHSMSEARFWSDVLGRDPVQTCADLYAVFLSASPNVQQAVLDGTEERSSDCEVNQKHSAPQG